MRHHRAESQSLVLSRANGMDWIESRDMKSEYGERDYLGRVGEVEGFGGMA